MYDVGRVLTAIEQGDRPLLSTSCHWFTTIWPSEQRRGWSW